MKIKSLPFIIFLFVSALGFSNAPTETASPLAPLTSLIGGVWVADVPVPAGQPVLKLEARFVWSENHQAIRFTSAFVRSDKPAPYTDGFYAWNAVKGKLAIYYTDSQGGLAEGLVSDEDGVLVNDLTVAEKKGTTEKVRTRLTKVDENTFTNAIFIDKDGAWTPVVTVRYLRQK